jgi:hypothetical protein
MMKLVKGWFKADQVMMWRSASKTWWRQALYWRLPHRKRDFVTSRLSFFLPLLTSIRSGRILF